VDGVHTMGMVAAMEGVACFHGEVTSLAWLQWYRLPQHQLGQQA